MSKYLIVFLFVTNLMYTQVAIVEDEDGFVNVMLKPSTDSEVIHKLHVGKVFFYGEDYYEESSQWVTVYIPKNIYSLNCTNSEFLEGFIHKSRIRPLAYTEKSFHKDVKLKYTFKPFQEEEKIIDFFEEKRAIFINGLKPWGTDGEMPKYEIEELSIYVKDEKIEVPEILTTDLFECNDSFDLFVVKDFYIIHQHHSDGAGFYELVWVIRDNKIVQRLVGSVY